MEKLVLIHHALFESLEEQIVCSFVGKISSRLKKSWNIFSFFFFIYKQFKHKLYLPAIFTAFKF